MIQTMVMIRMKVMIAPDEDYYTILVIYDNDGDSDDNDNDVLNDGEGNDHGDDDHISDDGYSGVVWSSNHTRFRTSREVQHRLNTIRKLPFWIGLKQFRYSCHLSNTV